MKKIFSTTCVALLMLINVQVHASPILDSFSSPSVFFSQIQTLGYAFSSDINISVSALGFWDSSQNGFAAGHEVGLWDGSGVLLGQASLAAGTGDTLIGDFRYADLSSAVSLTAGASYYLAGTTLNDDWVYQASSIVMDTGINYLGSYWAPSGVFAFPGNSAPEREYMTVNAITSTGAVPVPESATLALFGIGLAGLGFARRRKSA